MFLLLTWLVSLLPPWFVDVGHLLLQNCSFVSFSGFCCHFLSVCLCFSQMERFAVFLLWIALLCFLCLVCRCLSFPSARTIVTHACTSCSVEIISASTSETQYAAVMMMMPSSTSSYSSFFSSSAPGSCSLFFSFQLGRTGLMYATARGFAQTVSVLLQFGAAPEITDAVSQREAERASSGGEMTEREREIAELE